MYNKGLSQSNFDALGDYIASLPEKKGALMPVLHKAQNLFGYLPKEVQLFICERLDVPTSKIYGVISFYSFFTMKQRGQYVINICMGTACFVRKADDVVKEFEKKLGIKVGETSKNMMYSLEALRCVGACGLAPVVMVNDKIYGHVEKKDVKKILAEQSN
ncbi:MAG: NAD(P)H-dependent oxidoreductase subunit E [Alkaliphilus sp.]|nr:NAD(P)H-dependent oxidoreductase subunit E [bacterium AH-315-L21]PHS29722.1 MAG: NAD(P)H-dependent oxidoreductase subunit E [Alkaliphilus sp.]